MNFLTIRFLFFLLLGGAALAQQDTRIKLQLLTYAPNGLPEGMTAFFQSGDNVFSFRAASGHLGTPIHYEGPRQFVLREREADFNLPEGEVPLAPLAAVTLPERADQVLILAIPSQDSEESIRLVAYDLSLDRMKPGDYRVFNFSNQPLALRLGEQRSSINPGADAVLNGGAWEDDVQMIPLQIAMQEDGKGKIVHSSFWQHFPGNKSLLFMFNGKHRSSPIVFASFNAHFQELPPAKN